MKPAHRAVAELVRVFDGDRDDALERGLRNGKDPTALEVLPEQHAESRCGDRRFFFLFRYVEKRKGRRGGQKEQEHLPAAFHGHEDLLALRLGDLCDRAAGKAVIQFFYDACRTASVKCHDEYSFNLRTGRLPGRSRPSCGSARSAFCGANIITHFYVNCLFSFPNPCYMIKAEYK